MRLTRKAVLAGIASLAVAGAALAAEAPRFHTMNVNLPDGAVAHVRYSGDVAPVVTVDPAPAPHWIAPASFLAGFDPAPFAALDRMAAEMDRRADAMLREARGADRAGSGAPELLVAGGLPAGAGYSFVSETTSDRTCTRSIEMTRAAPTAKPRMVTRTIGNCTGAAPAHVPAAPGASAAAKPVKPAYAPAAGSGTI